MIRDIVMPLSRPPPSALGRHCDNCNSDHTTVDKRFVNSNTKGERWYKYYSIDGTLLGLECHNCYMKEWSKSTRKRKKRVGKNTENL